MTEIPAYVQKHMIGSAPIVDYSGSLGAAKQVGAVSAELAGFAKGMQETADKVEKYRAQASMRENISRISREIGPNPTALQASLDGFKKEFIKNLPSHIQEEFDAMYRSETVAHVDSAFNKYNDNLRNDLSTEGIRNFSASTNNMQAAVKLLETAKTPEQRTAAYDMMNSTISSINGIADTKDSEGMYIYSSAQRAAMGTEAITAGIRSLSPQAQLMAINPPVGFEANLQIIHKHEINQNDPDLVHPDGEGMAYRGINSVANPAEFAKIQGLLASGKNMEARVYADEIYKNKYWNAHNIDSLPANVQGIVFDAAVNQGGKLADELVKMVKNGSTPSELIQRRQEHYDSLKGKTPEERLSWAGRLNTFLPMEIGQNADLVDPAELSKIQDSIKKDMEKALELRAKDPVQFAYSNGLTLGDSIAEQKMSNPYKAPRILTNAQVEENVNRLTTAQNYLDVAQMASEIPDGEATEFYVNDMLNAKAPPSLVYSMLSMKKDAAYAKHVEYAHAYNSSIPKNADGTKIDEDTYLKGLGYDVDGMRRGIAEYMKNSKMDELILSEQGKDGVSSIVNTSNALYGVAAGYLMKNPGADVSDAVEFAGQPLLHGYVKGRVHGYTVRIPDAVKTAPIEKKLSEYIRDKAYDIKKDAKGDIILRQEMFPVYNDKTQQYEIHTQDRGLEYDRDGNPLSIGIKDLQSYETKQQKLAKLPAGPEKEALRKEMFLIDEQQTLGSNRALAEKMKKKPQNIEWF